MQKIKFTIKESVYSTISLPKAILYLLKNTWTWWLILIPLIINIVLTIFLWSWFKEISYNWLHALFIHSQNLSILENIIKGFIWILSLLISILAMILISLIVSAPFNGILAEKILIKHNIYQESQLINIKAIGSEIIRAINFELGKIFLSLIILIITSILNLIPIIGNILYVVINFLFTGFINTMDFYDPALSLLKYNFKEKKSYVWQRKFKNLVPILITSFLINIPFINVLFIPIGITAATLEVCD